MNKEQVSLAVSAGLEILGPNSQIAIPAKLTDGAFFLKQFLTQLAQGRLAITPTMQTTPAESPKDPPKPDKK